MSANGYRRNTPTCVGKTETGVKRIVTTEKHPHVRGEDPVDLLTILAVKKAV